MTSDDVYDASERSDLGGGELTVCALGASAGGLAPVEEFFDAMPSDTGMAFVVVQHLSPDHDSMMAALLESHTSMPITQAVDGDALQPNHVYLIPPGTEIRVSEQRMQVRDRRVDRRELHRPIDTFFESMAEDCGPSAIAIVLSGTGSDGAAGVELVRRSGGLTLAQDDSASFMGMPDAALRSGFVDAALAPAEIAQACLDFHAAGTRPVSAEHDHGDLSEADAELVALLEATTGILFTEYKPGTLRRRIERRVHMVGAADTREYLRLVRENMVELEELTREVLIDVTSFFRDPEMFAILGSRVMPQLVLEAAAAGDALRVWVAGCSTGPEAYSLAMVALEAIESVHGDKRPTLQVFATDVHSGSLNYASRGRYTEDEMQGVSVERRLRFFEQVTNGWRVKPELRSVITFAEHNVLSDAPFTRIDLVTCRNVMIYFQPSAQDRALGSMNFALRPGGAMILGSSEAPGAVEIDLETVSATWRMYRKKSDAVARSLRAGQLGSRLRIPVRTPAVAADQRLLRTYDALLDAQFASGLLLSERRELIHTIGGATEWMRQPKGRPTLDALSMVTDPNLRLALGATLRELESGVAEPEPRLVVPGPGEEREQAMLCGQIVRVGTTSHYLLYTKQVEQPVEISREVRIGNPDMEGTDYTLQLEGELAYTRESLQAAIEEQETSNEELNAANEELIASNEELQSTNEELQSVNEELRTLNDEHHVRLDQVLELTADLEQLMSSTEIGVIFLAENRTVRRFNEPGRDYFRVRDGDIDRPFEDVVSRLRYDDLDVDIDAVFAGLGARGQTVSHRDDRSRRLVVRIDRYELPRDRWGVFIAVVDVTGVIVAEEERALAAMLQGSPLAVAIATENGDLLYRNRSVIAGQSAVAFDENPHVGAFTMPELTQASRRALATGEPVVSMQSFEGLDHDAADGFEEFMYLLFPFELAGEPLLGGVALPAAHVAGSIELRARTRLLSTMSRHERIHVITFDHEGSQVDAYRLDAEADQTDLHDFGWTENSFENLWQSVDAAVHEGRPGRLVGRSQSESGTLPVADVHVLPIEDPLIGAIGIAVDVSDYEQRIAELEDQVSRLQADLRDAQQSGEERAIDLAERNHDLDNFAHVAAHDLKAPIRSIRSFTELAMEDIEDDSAALPHLQQVIGASLRMTSLLESLLDFASIDRQRPETGVIDLTEVVEGVVADLRSDIDRAGASIRHADSFDPISGDPAGVRQVVLNLVHNAIKYADDEPVVHISTRTEEDGVVVVVADNGVGFAMNDADRLFEPFHRLHDTSISGNGVGLAICKRIVERQGGRIWATSAEGEGSRFSFWLPRPG